jgi:signal transduction histidine kinase
MASGNLDQPIAVAEGGEITVLAESLETMRVQLKDSMEQVRTWGEELEAKVTERTQELAARNRQLAAVTAVATAANEIRDQEGMLKRCMEVVLEHSRMDDAAIRLVDASGSRLTTVSTQGDFSGFPCLDKPVGLEECPCGSVASNGDPLYLSVEEHQRFRPPCQVPNARAVALLPLKSPKGTLGVLSLFRNHGDPPGPEDRETLEAICNQIAIAIENARLLRELGQVETQRELDQMKAVFISTISHELRTPLGFIKGYATTLLREDIAVDPAARREFLEIIEEESDKLQRMIDELLDASRLQAGRLQIERETVGLRDLFDAALRRAAPVLRQAGHTLESHLPPADIKVLVDPGRIEQVLRNLIDNSARYSDPGSKIEVEVAVESDRVVISVRDHGDGVAAQDIERIFEPFYRGQSHRHRNAAGTGLGLAICRGIIESHGGRLWVDSTQGKGSTFTFTLPLAGRQDASDLDPRAELTSPGRGGE